MQHISFTMAQILPSSIDTGTVDDITNPSSDGDGKLLLDVISTAEHSDLKDEGPFEGEL